LPSPVRISAILPSLSAMPPISWTSKWRIFRVRLLASRTANTSGRSAERLAGADAAAELFGLCAKLGVAQLLERGLERVDLLHDLPVLLEQPVVAAAEDRSEKLGQHRVGGRMEGAVRAAPGAAAPARAAEARLELRPAGMNARRRRRPLGAKEPQILPAGPGG
jgi:hypothetical protein